MKFAVEKDMGNSKSLRQRERVSVGIPLTGGKVFHRRLPIHKTARAASAVVWKRTTNWRQPQRNPDLLSTLRADACLFS